ncbi:hypothetical protein GPECTOR_54g193 [Gonium pectorale]|uniref:Uncharacterized protein n=1 Tax=Gonium pectorale TaxID=33097 RepID=A0A150G6I0_GONPE|nr:hypothetical protein GPECTOR_54g193 [Gonium pectorale]|eukprot:KXZ45452.1 hypothetical protein GPECTOR_54g193 [Gonium pectorale]
MAGSAELGGDSDAGEDAEAQAEGGLLLPAPPLPPADRSRWTVRVWDMPVSAAERQKPTAAGGVARRRLLHVAGARAVLASALRFALPPRGSNHRVALYGYVEVPPILPGDGNISAYTSLFSTGVWLGLLSGMGFMVGSTPVRRWKTDLGLFGARGKDAALDLARALFPDHVKILTLKKHHGRADALLIAAWALGACLPPRLSATMRRSHITIDQVLAKYPGVGLAWGEPRPPAPTDAYGNLLMPELDLAEETEAAQTKADRAEAARAAAAERKLAKGSGGARRRRKPADDAGDKAVANLDGDEAGGAARQGALGMSGGQGGEETTPKRSRRRAAARGAAAEEEATGSAVAGANAEEVQSSVVAAPRRRARGAGRTSDVAGQRVAQEGAEGVNGAGGLSAEAAAGAEQAGDGLGLGERSQRVLSER